MGFRFLFILVMERACQRPVEPECLSLRTGDELHTVKLLGNGI